MAMSVSKHSSLFRRISAHITPSRISGKPSAGLRATMAKYAKNRDKYGPLSMQLKDLRYEEYLNQDGLASKLRVPRHKLAQLESPSPGSNIQGLSRLAPAEARRVRHYIGWNKLEMQQAKCAASLAHQLQLRRWKRNLDVEQLSMRAGGYLFPEVLGRFASNTYTRDDLKLLTVVTLKKLFMALDFEPPNQILEHLARLEQPKSWEQLFGLN